MILLIVKNVDHFKYADLLKFDKKKFDYSKIKKIGNFDGFDFYKSENWQCADFEKICINKQKNKYRVKVINNYIFFLKN